MTHRTDGLCPSCEANGTYGEPCSERVCARRGIGMTGDGVTCVEIDACIDYPCGPRRTPFMRPTRLSVAVLTLGSFGLAVSHGCGNDPEPSSHVDSCEGTSCPGTDGIDPCASTPCGAGTCIAEGSDYACACPEGSVDDGTTCRDADDCADTPCGAGVCTDTGTGTYRCTCAAGEFFDETNCVTCAAIAGCDAWTCTNASTSMCTTCSLGYTDNGNGGCAPVGGCATRSCGDGQCIEHPDFTTTCDCPAGQYDDLTTCVACPELEHCDAVACTSTADATCVNCADGFDIVGPGCVDANDCDPDPCAVGECIDTGTNSYECRIVPIIGATTGGTATVETDLGAFTATAASSAFVNQAGQPSAGEIRLEIATDGFDGVFITPAGDAFDPIVMADFTFVDAAGAPVRVASGQLVNITLPLPSDATHAVGASIAVLYFDAPANVWAFENTGTIIARGDTRAVSASVSHFTWYAVGATCSALDNCSFRSCDLEGCSVCELDFALVNGACARIDNCVNHACGAGNCVDGLNDYACVCPTGSTGTGSHACTTCPALANCTTTTCDGGASTCTACDSGYALTRGACVDIDDCAGDPCAIGTCTDTGVNSYACDCPNGSYGDGTRSCIACPTSTVAGCTAVTCTDANDSKCTACGNGYRLEGSTCSDIDDCANHTCGQGACIDKLNGYTCDCPDGTYGDGSKTCTSCRPSTIPACASTTCTNGTASTCAACDTGYVLRNGRCDNIDDCVNHTCGDGRCVDGINAYTCDCPDGSYGDGTHCRSCPASGEANCTAVSCSSAASSTCVGCATGYALANGRCIDGDDCASNPCGAGTCTDVGVSAYTCQCPSGHFGSGTSSCTPCALITGCTALSCTGTGTSTCAACGPGYALVAGACMDIDACVQNPCGLNAACTDQPAPAGAGADGRTCHCAAGYEGNAIAGCTDINDCASNPCGAGTCTDTGANAHTCQCPSGQFGTGTTSCTECTSMAGCTALTCTTSSNSTCSACGIAYTLVDGACVDNDDCHGHTCGVGTCVDGVGGYACDCPEETFGDGTTSCTSCDPIAHCSSVTCTSPSDESCVVCEAGYTTNSGGCVDVDDCIPNPCVVGTCTDTGPNSFTCDSECDFEGISGSPFLAIFESDGTYFGFRDLGSATTLTLDFLDPGQGQPHITPGVYPLEGIGRVWADGWARQFVATEGTVEISTFDPMTHTLHANVNAARLVEVAYDIDTGSYEPIDGGAVWCISGAEINHLPECETDDDCGGNAPKCRGDTRTCAECVSDLDCPATSPVCGVFDCVSPFCGAYDRRCGVVDVCPGDDDNENDDDGPNGATEIMLPSEPISGKLCHFFASPFEDVESDWYEFSLADGQLAYMDLMTTEPTIWSVVHATISKQGAPEEQWALYSNFDGITVSGPGTFNIVVRRPSWTPSSWTQYEPALTDYELAVVLGDCSSNPCNGGMCTVGGARGYDCRDCPAGTFDYGPTCAPCNCDDGDPCTTDTCHPVMGCSHSFTPNEDNCVSAFAEWGYLGDWFSPEGEWYPAQPAAPLPPIVAMGVPMYAQATAFLGADGVAYAPTQPRDDGGVGGSLFNRTFGNRGNWTPKVSDVVAIGAGNYWDGVSQSSEFHYLALRKNGTVYAWGGDSIGQTTVPADLVGVVAVDAGAGYSLALDAEGVVHGWGDGGASVPLHLGKHWDDSSNPQADPTNFPDVIAISAGPFHALAIRQCCTVAAWGAGWGAGELNVPEEISEDDRRIRSGSNVQVHAVAAGGGHSLALVGYGDVWGWGANDEGQATPPANLSGVIAIAAGGRHSLALKSDGTVVAWGANFGGQIDVPPDLDDVIGIYATSSWSHAVLRDGSVVSWGGWSSDPPTTTSPPNKRDLASIDGYIGLRADGSVIQWGGQRNDTPVSPGDRELIMRARSDGTDNYLGLERVPAVLRGPGSAVAIAAGGGHSLALTPSGGVVVWGDNQVGQLVVPEGLSNVTAIAAGGGHSLALRSDGTVVAWGNNASGQCDVPPDLSDVVAIEAGLWNSVATKADGTRVLWGHVPWRWWLRWSKEHYASVALGYTHVLALTHDGAVVAGGECYDDQECVVPPELVGVPVTAISTHYRHNLVLKRDGSVSAWGENGDGAADVPPLPHAYAVSASLGRSLALVRSDLSISSLRWASQANTTIIATGTGFTDVFAVQLGDDFVRYRVVSPTRIEIDWPGPPMPTSPVRFLTATSGVSSTKPIQGP